MRNMDRWLGDGGMRIIDAIGASFETYGSTDDGVFFAEAVWQPTPLACNPHGVVQGGVHAILLDAAMNFAINAGLDGRDRTRATLEMKIETMRAARAGDRLRVRGEVVRMARQIAYAEARVTGRDGTLLSRSTGTFILRREPASPGGNGRPAGAERRTAAS